MTVNVQTVENAAALARTADTVGAAAAGRSHRGHRRRQSPYCCRSWRRFRVSAAALSNRAPPWPYPAVPTITAAAALDGGAAAAAAAANGRIVCDRGPIQSQRGAADEQRAALAGPADTTAAAILGAAEAAAAVATGAANGLIVVEYGTVHSERDGADEQAAALAAAAVAAAGHADAAGTAAATDGLIQYKYAVAQNKRSASHRDAATGSQSSSAAEENSLPSSATLGMIRFNSVVVQHGGCHSPHRCRHPPPILQHRRRCPAATAADGLIRFECVVV